MTTILIVLLTLAIAGLIYFGIQSAGLRKKAKRLEAESLDQRTTYDADVKGWTEKSDKLEAQIARLAKWEGVADADAKAQELLRSAQDTLSEATASVAQVTADARQEAKALKDQAQANLGAATEKAAEIVESANKKAEEIAGSAYEAMKNASLYEQTVKAMKNIIQGYGDEYIIPGRSLLDDLAADYSHKEAGQDLKRARDRTALMIRNGTAATCDYVEAYRKETAINFVTVAFNGKVDSILSRVKHDNVGTLEQEMRDAFTLVNFNGKAFRDARITEEFLAARIEELKWASIAQQLRLEEREEQRRIKEQLREEEKARREYENAIKDAAREEEIIRKAMEKAQRQIEHATAEQRVKFEQQLRELSQKLKEAEEKNQRAISLAQQTKRGHVYIISNIGSFGEHVYKIGLTRRLEPLDRIRELGDSSVPFEFDVHALIFSEDAPALENQLHKHFLMLQMNKVNYRKEFFRVDLTHIREEIDKLNLSTKWTMTAEAQEYHETLAIEKAIKDNSALRDAWVKRQLSLEPAGGDIQEPVGLEEEK